MAGLDISHRFIDRPILAGVLSFFIFIAGSISMFLLPISEYPEVVPPSVIVTATYPGANPKVIAETVAAPLEEQINGVENMLYMSSQATTDGTMTLTVTFKLGVDPDLAQELVQNRVAQATPRLPDVVRTLGVTTVKSSSDFIMVVHIISPDGRYDTDYLHNYGIINVKDQLARLGGIGQVQAFGGGDYAMRVWLDPNKMASRNLSASDVTNAIREQNIQIAAGTIGAQPSGKDVPFEMPVNVQGRLKSIDEFEDIIIKTDNQTGAVTHLRDVGRVELGASTYALRSLLDNKSAAAFGIFQSPGSNALDLAKKVRATMEEIKKSFPDGVAYDIVYDPTRFVDQSIDAVIQTLFEAILLVVLVVIIFLQTWRASIIPLLAVPISIVGTFAIMHMIGFSINALSLFGLVLAIGIVVDDAIVVVENVERNIENGLSPREATYVAMREVSGPIIAIALVLCAVFVPVAFISGLTGQFYRQFALTIAISTIISAFNSLTLSPALAAMLLRGHDAPKDRFARGMDKVFGGFFRRFNTFFTAASHRYGRVVKWSFHHKSGLGILYVILLAVTVFGFTRVPGGYVPSQDKQYLVAFAQLPPGSSLERTDAVIRQMSDLALKHKGVAHSVAFPGLSIAGFSNSSSGGIVFVTLDPFEKRTTADLSAGAIAGALNKEFSSIQGAFVAIFPPPPVMGLGTIGGFKLEIEDRTDMGYDALAGVLQKVQGTAYKTPGLAGVFSTFENVPQLDVNINRVRAKQQGIALGDLFDTLQIYLGNFYVNDFNLFGRTYQVYASADAPFRSSKEDISQLKVRSATGAMVPLGSLVDVQESFGPSRATRYNAFRAADMNGDAAPGFSSGQAKDAITKILNDTLPKGMTFEWTELTYQQILAGNTAMLVFPMCVLFVFLVLAAQYESLGLPLAVILVVPLCLFGSIIGVWIMGRENNIFTQIGFIVLVGLACKNAILIVEFARELEHQGRSVVEAAFEASHLRLRPILMTSFAFIMGVIPLATATGAGSEMRQDMGVAVFSGMIGVTFFGLLMTPMFYVIVRSVTLRFFPHKPPHSAPPHSPTGAPHA